MVLERPGGFEFPDQEYAHEIWFIDPKIHFPSFCTSDSLIREK